MTRVRLSDSFRRFRWVAFVGAVLFAFAVVLSVDGYDLAGPPEGKIGESEATHAPRVSFGSFAEIVDDVKAIVVNITATPAVPAKRLGLRRQAPPIEASGLIIDSAGHVITNEHVIHQARAIRVQLSHEEEYQARVVGSDPWSDLALLKIEAPRRLPAAVLGDSDRIRVGDWILAVGNPFGLDHSVTVGIVSAKGRVIGEGPDDDFLQTDAATYPGSSGGPLFDLRGEVVGIHNIGYGETDQSAGISLAIPINLVRAIIPELQATGRVIRGAVGIGILPITADVARKLGRPNRDGAYVASVQAKGPGQRAGLRTGDVVIAFQAQPIRQAHELARLVSKSVVGSEARLTVIRGNATLDLKVTLGELKGRPTPGDDVRPMAHEGAVLQAPRRAARGWRCPALSGSAAGVGRPLEIRCPQPT
jgi:S1-C subfamily serine protease